MDPGHLAVLLRKPMTLARPWIDSLPALPLSRRWPPSHHGFCLEGRLPQRAFREVNSCGYSTTPDATLEVQAASVRAYSTQRILRMQRPGSLDNGVACLAVSGAWHMLIRHH